MTRPELQRLKTASDLLGKWTTQDRGFEALAAIIADAEGEHAAEDQHNDWAELAQQPHQIAAE